MPYSRYGGVITIKGVVTYSVKIKQQGLPITYNIVITCLSHVNTIIIHCQVHCSINNHISVVTSSPVGVEGSSLEHN